MNHILPEKCPACGEVVRNDMAVVRNSYGARERILGHVQFACNYEVEIQPGQAPMILRECRKGKIWPSTR